MKTYEFLVDAGVLVYYIEAENEEEADTPQPAMEAADGDAGLGATRHISTCGQSGA